MLPVKDLRLTIGRAVAVRWHPLAMRVASFTSWNDRPSWRKKYLADVGDLKFQVFCI